MEQLRVCVCACHSTARGVQRALTHKLDVLAETASPHAYGERHRKLYHAARDADAYLGVTTDDVLEAAVACDACRQQHCPALQTPGRVPPPRPVKTLFEEACPPSNPIPEPPADGDQEKGDETGG